MRPTTLIRALPRLATPARTFASSSIIRSDPPSSKPVPPADIVAGAHAGPVTVHETPEEITAHVVSDAPAELRYRPVRIYKPTKTTMQSAKGKTKRWLLDWDVLQGSGRWENPLMGWASTADYMQGTQMAFPSKEEAIAFAERQGWEYQVQTPHEPKIPPKNYGKLRIHHTK